MPLRNEVPSLEELAKKKIHEILVLNKDKIKEEAYKWRLVFIEYLPGNTRTDLLSYGLSKYDSKLCKPSYPLGCWVPLSVALFDKRIEYLPPIFISDLENNLPLLMSFVTYLWIYRPKIIELFMHLVYVNINLSTSHKRNRKIQFSMDILSKCFDEGLATNLVQLQLTYQCDDSILSAIGRHAKCLKLLDVSCSSGITVDGIKRFIFKDLNILKNFVVNEDNVQLLHSFLRNKVENREILNTICFTLEEIRLQYTKTNNFGWIIILSCIQSLRHLGWPGKWNIKKLIMTVWHEIIKPKPLNLQSITLFDWDMVCDEIYTMTECLPYLRNLNTTLTRNYKSLINNNHQILMKFWNKLHSLTLHIMENTIEYFELFCRNGYIQNLSQLIIRSVSFAVINYDVALLQSGCPNLIVLDIVSVSLYINLKPTGKFKHLKKVTMEAPVAETKSWFLLYGCPSLEEFKIFNEMDCEYWKNIFVNPPPLVCQQMKSLEIVFVLSNGNTDTLNQSCIMNYLIITEFITKCLVLNKFGSVLNVNIMNTQDIENINNFIRMHNYSLTIY